MPATDDFAGNLSAAALELLFTFAIVLVALNALREMPNSYYGIAVGLTVVAGMYSANQYSGGAFNPALALGLQAACALGPGDCSMRSQVIYWVATLAGGALAAGAYVGRGTRSSVACAAPSPAPTQSGHVANATGTCS